MQYRDIIGQAGYRGVPADNAKPSKKVFSGPIAEQQHLRGGAVGITAETPPERKARGWGLRPPYTVYNTASRTILAHTASKHLQRMLAAASGLNITLYIPTSCSTVPVQQESGLCIAHCVICITLHHCSVILCECTVQAASQSCRGHHLLFMSYFAHHHQANTSHCYLLGCKGHHTNCY